MGNYRIAYTFIFVFLMPCFVGAQLTLAPIFSNNMILQRDQPIVIYGKANPGNTVLVSMYSNQQNTIVQTDSVWKIIFPRQGATSEPFTLSIHSGTETIQLHNLLIGDVWVCIGQSNMEWPMMREKHFREEKASNNQPLMRFFNPVYAGKNIFNAPFTDSVVERLTPNNFFSGQWQICDSNSIRTLTAVGYYFAKEIVKEINVPVGIIHYSMGGAPLESFISKDAMLANPAFTAKVSGNWLLNPALPDWIRERGMQNVGKVSGVPEDGNGKNHAFKPGFAYLSAIQPLTSFPVKGFLCYQGESNAQELDRVREYADLFACMVNDYRLQWNQPEMPFYFVQLSSIDTVKYKGHLWPIFRDEQRKILQKLSHTGMAVTSDIGARDDVHPTNKKTVGERLARWALHDTYGRSILPSGPLPTAARLKKGKLIISFQYAGKGLQTNEDTALQGFSVENATIQRVVINRKKVVISVTGKPTYVCYGWKSFSDGNLVNNAGLPASTFRMAVQNNR